MIQIGNVSQVGSIMEYKQLIYITIDNNYNN